jgi:hypothetical protein
MVFVNDPDNTKIDAYIGTDASNVALAGRIACSTNPDVSGSIFLPIKAGQNLYVLSWYYPTKITLICRFYPI